MDARRSDQFEDAAIAREGVARPAEAPAPAAAAVAKPKKGWGKRLVMAAILMAGLGGGGSYGWHWWTVGRYQISTDDAFLDADKVTVAPRVSGYVAEALVADNQPVHKGDLIARLDDREYHVALSQAEANAEKARADLAGADASLAQQQAQIASLRADVTTADAALTFSQQEYARYQNLLQSGAGTVQRQQQADADLRQRKAARDKTQAVLEAAQRQVDGLKAQRAGVQAALDAALAQVEQAKLNLTYTRILASIDGVVGDRSLRPGQFVTAGTNLLTLVPMGPEIYLVANYKETQTAQMTVGQPVTILLDAFGDHEFKGRVESFAPGTGAQFALLPTDNATGNFTKIVQRVPVRIALDAADPLLAKLRPGLSAEATVHTRDEAPVRVGEADLR